MAYFLGIDNGGTRLKAALFDENGTQLASAAEDTPLTVTAEGWQERDMEELWQAAARTIREAVSRSGVDPAEIAGVGCTGHGKGLYLWGKDGKPVRPAVASTDSRAADVVAAWNADGTAEQAAVRTLQPLDACQPAPLLAWLKKHEPENYGRIAWVFEAKDYLRFRLTGEARAEYTDYSGTSLMDLNTRSFDRELLELFGIPEVWPCLPPLCRSDEVCGHVTAQAAEETGLPEGVPVCGGMFDIDACAIAVGVTGGECLCAIAGTWGINEYISRTPVPGNSTTRNSIYCIPEWYLIEESSPASSGNLEWVREQLLSGPERDYDAISAMVASVPPEAGGPVFAPYLYGSNMPGCDSGLFFGLKNRHTKAHLLRAVFEGVAYTHRIHIERLLAHRERPETVRLTGGAAASRVWAQMFADVLNCAVEVVPAGEPGALGCAMAAAVASGRWADYEAASAAMTPKRVRLEPDPARVDVYEKNYRAYKALLERIGAQ